MRRMKFSFFHLQPIEIEKDYAYNVAIRSDLFSSCEAKDSPEIKNIITIHDELFNFQNDH